jgi:hypothetical protein
VRGLKLTVAFLAIWSLGLTLFIINLGRTAKRNQNSFETLVNLLEVHRWEIPMPKDTSLEWSFELRDFREPVVVSKGMDDWMDSSKKAKIVFMPTGEEAIHRFWLVQTNGTSSGRTRVDVCESPEQLQRTCDVGQFEYIWYPTAQRVEDGKTYIICELNETFSPHRRKQLVLHLSHFRIEDIQKDAEKPPNNAPTEPKRIAPKSDEPKPPTAKS